MGSKLSLYQTFIFTNDIHILSKKGIISIPCWFRSKLGQILGCDSFSGNLAGEFLCNSLECLCARSIEVICDFHRCSYAANNCNYICSLKNISEETSGKWNSSCCCIPNSCMQYFKSYWKGQYRSRTRVYWIIILLLEPAIEICIQHKLHQEPLVV